MFKVFSNWYYHFRCVLPGVPKLPKITSLLLQHVKKEVSDAVDFLHADKHESLLQIDTKIFWWVWSSIPKVPKKASLQCLYNIPKKVRDEVDFFDADKHQSFLQFISTLGHQSFLQCDRHDYENVKGIVMGIIKHSQSNQSNKFAMSLQYL